MAETKIRRPKPCWMCGEFDSTAGENVVERRRIGVTGGRWVHFACLGDWLIRVAMDNWLGPMKDHERAVMRERLGLPHPSRKALASLSEAAGIKGYTGAWLSSQVQNPAIRRLEERVARANERPTVEEQEQARNARIQKLAEEILELTTTPRKVGS